MVKRPRVGLLIQSSLEYGRGLLRGIGEYIAQHGPWSVYHRPGPLVERLPEDFRRWRPDAVIAQLESPTLVRQVRALRLPTVDLFALHRLPGVPQLAPDHRAIARMVADYFLDRGYREFAYCGFEGVYYCELRSRHFVEYLARRGHRVRVYAGRVRRATEGVFSTEAAGLLETARLGRWLASLPKPVALMAGSDVRAQQVLSACGEAGIAVPAEVAVCGVSNDEVCCRLCDPQLTSVDLNTERIGYEAAAVLDRLRRGRRAPARMILVPPRGIISRRSTQASGVSDPDLLAALQFIHDQGEGPLTVEAVARHVALSRSTLQRRFAAALGRSPQAEIRDRRLDRVKRLLVETDRPLAAVAQLCGFRHAESMCRLFRRRVGQTPGAYRRQHAAPGAADQFG